MQNYNNIGMLGSCGSEGKCQREMALMKRGLMWTRTYWGLILLPSEKRTVLGSG